MMCNSVFSERSASGHRQSEVFLRRGFHPRVHSATATASHSATCPIAIRQVSILGVAIPVLRNRVFETG